VNVLTGVVVLVTLVAGIVLVASLRRTPSHEAPAPERAEHWLIVQTAHRPRVQRIVRSVDRRVAGGCALAACLTALGMSAMAVGWILDSVDTNRGFARWDRSVAAWGSDHATTFSTTLLRTATQLGDTTVVVVLLVGVSAWDYRQHHRKAVFGFVATIIIGVTALNNTLKLVVGRDRPIVQQLIGSAGSSFPSGHSATAAAGWAALLLIVERSSPRSARRWLAVAAILVTVTVAASRALLGVHWLTDVIAGAIVGWTWFFLVAVVFGGRILRFGDPAARRADGSALRDGNPADATEVCNRPHREQRSVGPTVIDTDRGIETGFDT
jgi:membrane-associated phospholipid phosphatase